MLIRSAALLSLLVASSTNAQFTCTLTNTDESSCVNAKGDDSEHCVWCSLAGFGFCVGEQQAEKMEENLPGIQCDRYSQTDDAAPATDDAAPTPTDDTTPTNDDGVKPSDDSVPDDFWTCLQKKDTKSCLSAGCTWCDSNNFGFGLCMTGPTAESASDSAFFTCHNSTLGVEDPMDTACMMAFLQDPTAEGCTAAQDSQGDPCEWCTIAGMANVCLTKEQADMGSPLGISCQEQEEGIFASLVRHLTGSAERDPRDPFDTACLLAFAQNPTEEGCEAATDSDGGKCEFCTIQQYQLCLTEEQAMYGQEIGMECVEPNHDILKEGENFEKEEMQITSRDPYDTSCVLAFLTNPTEEACTSAVDQDGGPCEFCTLQGSLNLCLTHEQAEMGESIGLQCGSNGNIEAEEIKTDILDTSCAMAFAQANGNISPEECTSAADSEGVACEFCTIPGLLNSLCLTTMQAEMAQKFAGNLVQCGEGADHRNVNLPPNFFDCLKQYQEGDCNSAVDGCTWCTSQVGIGFCMADAAARALSECDFFSCDTSEQQEFLEVLKEQDDREFFNEDDDMQLFDEQDVVFDEQEDREVFDEQEDHEVFNEQEDLVNFAKENLSNAVARKVLNKLSSDFPLDPVCLAAGMGSEDDAENVCNNTVDSEGSPCVWCNAAGVYGLCMSSQGASMAHDYLTCDNLIEAAE